MPEPPDFDQIARTVAKPYADREDYTDEGVFGVSPDEDELTAAIAEQLRQVWNARCAIAATEARVRTCAACRHWARRDVELADALGLWDSDEEKAANRAAYEQWGHCAAAFSERDEPQFPGTKAYATDYESYKASFLTREDFGCVQWERRDA